MSSANNDEEAASSSEAGNVSDPVSGNLQGVECANREDEQLAAGSSSSSADLQDNVPDEPLLSPDISLSSQRTLRYCDVEADQRDLQDDTPHDESSDSIETLSELPSQDSHVELNNKILEQLSLTCQNLKNSVESHQRAERERRARSKSPAEDAEGFVSSGDSHEVIPESRIHLRPESLSLPRPLQSIEREKSGKGSSGSKSKNVAAKPPDSRPEQQQQQQQQRQQQGACFIDSEKLPGNLPSGTIVRKGDMIEFVADNLEQMIKLSSPPAPQDSGSGESRRSSERSVVSASSSTSFATSSGLSRSRSPSSLFQQSPDDIPPIDAAAVVELENHAKRVADSLDLMMGNIGNNLHKMSAITIGCEDAYKRSVDITCDSVDSSIKAMYALMAKCEELSAAMGPVAQLAAQIKEIKRILDLFESQLSDK